MKNHNPLDGYLKKNNITRREFADILTGSRGWPAYETHVSTWATGAVLPNPATRRTIAIATNGQVPVESWAGLKRRTIAKGQRG